MIIFVGAVKIIDGEDESWKTRIIHSKMFSLCFLLQICYTEAIVIKNIRILLIIIPLCGRPEDNHHENMTPSNYLMTPYILFLQKH